MGVATFLGILLGLAWQVGALACLTWLLVAAAFRYSSLAALIAAVLAPVFAWLLAPLRVAELAAVLAILVVVKHHQNIRRLIAGEEPKIGGKRSG
jgi:glycerol-3-phosphate acyltransferase PlsY